MKSILPVATPKPLVFVLFASIILFSLSACDDTEDCSTSGSNAVIFRSVQFNLNGAKVEFPRIFDELRPIGTDSVLFSNANAAQVFFPLPLNPAADSTAFFIRRGARLDTLVIGYTRSPQFISPTCGVEVLYNKVFIQYSTLVDSINIVRNNIRRTDTYHVEIYR